MAENQIPLDRIPDIYDWDFSVRLEGARMLDLEPCWQSAPLDEDRRHRITGRSVSGFDIVSYTSRRRCLFNRDTHSIVMAVEDAGGGAVSVETRAPGAEVLRVPFTELLERSAAVRVGRCSLKIHRLAPRAGACVRFMVRDGSDGEGTDWYYARAAQKNGQLAWSSPVWVERKE